jgi:hypothetical protein
MERFRGKVMDGGRVLFEGIEGTLTQQAGQGGQRSYSGFFSVPSGVPVRTGKAYRLLLDDGRSAEIILEKASSPSHRPTVVQFRVNGDLK